MLVDLNQSNSDVRFAFIDVFRCIAALAVVWQHVGERVTISVFEFVTDLAPGLFGVVLSFVISGFVIPPSAKNGLNLPVFVIGRIFRIYPALAATFLPLFLCHISGLIVVPQIGSAVLENWLANFFLCKIT